MKFLPKAKIVLKSVIEKLRVISASSITTQKLLNKLPGETPRANKPDNQI